MKRLGTKAALSIFGILALLMIGGTTLAAHRTSVSTRQAICGQDCSVRGTICSSQPRCICSGPPKGPFYCVPD